MSRLPTQKALNTSRSSSFSAGRAIAAPGTSKAAGGANLTKGEVTQSGGGALNKGRLNGGKEIHHNGGPRSIAKGSTNPPR